MNRHINYIVSWKLKQISFFSETLQRKAQQIKDAVIVTKRVSGLLELMAGQLDHLASHTLAEANELHENHPGIKVKKKNRSNLLIICIHILSMKRKVFLRKCNKNNMFIKQKRAQSSYSLFLKNYVYTVNEKIILTQSME